MRRLAGAVGLVLAVGAWLVAARPAEAKIMRLVPLREVLNSEEHIFIAKVEAIDAAKPTMVVKVDEQLKGKVPFEKLPVNLTGDSEAEKEKQTPQLLKRLARDLPLILFTSKRGERYTAFVYTNGTWFQMIGH